MSTSYHYTCYGCTFVSPFECPELEKIDSISSPDVEISEGETPKTLVNPTHIAARFSTAPGELLLRIDNVANFWVSNGNKIVVQPADVIPVILWLAIIVEVDAPRMISHNTVVRLGGIIILDQVIPYAPGPDNVAANASGRLYLQ